MNETIYYVDEKGVYLGGYSGAEPPEGAIEVPAAPDDARQIWGFPGWGETPVAVPTTVTKRQAKLALLDSGILDDVETLVSSLDRGTRIEWEDSTEFHRDSPIISSLAKGLGLSEKDVDTLFLKASAM